MEHATRGWIGRRVKAARRAKGFTAEELARKAGVTENAIRKLESGDTKEPRLSTALRIADALGVTPDFVSDYLPESRRNRSAPELASVIRKIRQCRHALTQRGVAHVRVFGSVARGDAGPRSDVDAIVEPSETARFTLFDLEATRLILAHALDRQVDVITDQTVRRSGFAKTAEMEAVSAF
jgi:uncharacterized protein